MTERRMSPKGFLNKIVKAKSAEGFFAQYREYLLTGELFPLTTAIVAKVDNGELLPTPALEELGFVVMAHLQAAALASIEKQEQTSSKPRSSGKPVQAIIYNSAGEEVESESFYLGQDAQRWTDRHLISQSPDCVGKVIHTKVMIQGKPMEETITREDAYFRSFPRKKTPFMKRTPTSVSSLKGKMKVGQSRASFSHG